MTQEEKQKALEIKRAQKDKRKAAKKEARIADKKRIAEEKKRDREERFRIDDPIGFMRIMNVMAVVLILIALFLGVRYIVNLVSVHNYNQGVYSTTGQRFLSHLNVPEGYLPYYNIGNVFYQMEDYDNAIASYQKALESHPTKKRECDIRVNLALAMLHKIDFDHIETEKQKNNAIRQLQAARNVLCEKGCADPYGTDGHDEDAEQLKQDIDKMLNQLGAEPEPPDSDGEEQQKKGGGGNDEEKKKSQREQQLEKDLNKQKKDAMQERRETQDAKDQQEQNQQSSGYGGSESGDTYNGKTW